ncbi:AraC family transcriptional regulator [Massilia sp. S19_KUP03_FR1]|uniref:AraC family transcriptional regulator n=1 Tax=Massilia sp. S19_KUP03_FR1 TaxID=3025503 RepID=UPI002FCDC6B9
MDALSDVLSLLKPASYMFRGIDAGGDWGIRFAEHRGINCYAVLSGQVWLTLEGVQGGSSVLLEAGDCVLLPRGHASRLTSAPGAASADACDVFPTVEEGGVVKINGGGEVFGLGGYFAFEGPHADILLGVLPPLVHIRQETDRAALRSSIERIMQELRVPQPGGFLIARHLIHLMLLQALRLFLAQGPAAGVGWIYALGDKQVGAALNALHGDPARKWTLAALADIAAMSRSTFALRFRERVGEAPIDYLTRWRMLLAADRLRSSRDAIGVIAPALGYASESAFSTAFKRVMGCAPRDYARALAS